MQATIAALHCVLCLITYAFLGKMVETQVVNELSFQFKLFKEDEAAGDGPHAVVPVRLLHIAAGPAPAAAGQAATEMQGKDCWGCEQML